MLHACKQHDKEACCGSQPCRTATMSQMWHTSSMPCAYTSCDISQARQCRPADAAGSGAATGVPDIQVAAAHAAGPVLLRLHHRHGRQERGRHAGALPCAMRAADMCMNRQSADPHPSCEWLKLRQSSADLALWYPQVAADHWAAQHEIPSDYRNKVLHSTFIRSYCGTFAKYQHVPAKLCVSP